MKQTFLNLLLAVVTPSSETLLSSGGRRSCLFGTLGRCIEILALILDYVMKSFHNRLSGVSGPVTDNSERDWSCQEVVMACTKVPVCGFCKEM
jgi:hypothetical protein